MRRAIGATATRTATPYAWGALTGLATFAVYLSTLAPTTALWDASEYITAAKVLGLPHPPGNPLFVVAAHAFGAIPLPVTYAARINIFTALCSAVASSIWFLVADRIMLRAGIDITRRRIAAAAGVFASATTFTVWNQSTVNEKVYMLSLAILAATSWQMLQWIERRGDARNHARLAVVSLLLGAGYAVHPAGLLPALAVLVTVATIEPRLFVRPKLVGAIAAAFVLGLTPFAFEPIRSAQQPVLNEGAPSGCEERLALSCTFSLKTYQRLAANINRDQYAKPSVLDRQAPFDTQLGMLSLYFRWQWLRDAHGTMPMAQSILALAFLTLGIYGMSVHWRLDRGTFAYWATLMVTLSVILVYYLNFKYGFSQSPELGDSVPREVRDRDYFFVWFFSAWGVWTSIAIVDAWRRWRPASALVVLCILPALLNAGSASRRHETIARDWAFDLLDSAEPYGIILTNGDNDTFPLWYAQNVEGKRRDVTVVLGTYLAIDWYTRQLLRARPDAFNPREAPGLFATTRVTRPTDPIVAMMPAQADAVPDYIEIATPQVFRAAGIEGRVEPGYLTRDEILVLRIISDTFPKRPIYFSPGSSYPARLGVQRYVVRQGLLERLSRDSTANGALDVPASAALWNLYRGPAAIVRRGDWVDRASLSVPVNYAILGATLGDALAHAGAGDAASRVGSDTNALIAAARLGEMFGAAPARR